MSVLKYSYDMYNPSALGQLSISEQRAEYRRLQRIAERRLNALGRSEFRMSRTYLENVGQYPRVSTLSDKEVKYYLSNVGKFLARKRSSVTGLRQIRKETIETLHERGYKFVNAKNYERFHEFMDETATAARNSKYDSDTQVDMFEMMERKRVDPDELEDDFEYWLANYEKLEGHSRKALKGKSSKELRKLVEKKR